MTTLSSMPDPNSSNGSSKRSKHPHPPLSTPPGQVAFRLLCHASRIGGVIGKSGTVIKNLQQSTAAKIRIEDAPLDLPDRVILVVAHAALTGKLGLKNRNGEEIGEVVVEVSKAQEALVKVFDTILEVAAESDGLGVWVGVVSCWLLAEAAQVDSVIGMGGKVVEKIRKDSGSKISCGERERDLMRNKERDLVTDKNIGERKKRKNKGENKKNKKKCDYRGFFNYFD
jgi:predicted RNA-binding protein YlqC (UPF0109 family)